MNELEEWLKNPPPGSQICGHLCSEVKGFTQAKMNDYCANAQKPGGSCPRIVFANASIGRDPSEAVVNTPRFSRRFPGE